MLSCQVILCCGSRAGGSQNRKSNGTNAAAGACCGCRSCSPQYTCLLQPLLPSAVKTNSAEQHTAPVEGHLLVLPLQSPHKRAPDLASRNHTPPQVTRERLCYTNTAEGTCIMRLQREQQAQLSTVLTPVGILYSFQRRGSSTYNPLRDRAKAVPQCAVQLPCTTSASSRPQHCCR